MDHPFPAVFRQDSHILILGSFPSVRSREEGFFYGHPQNRFWKVVSAVMDVPCPQTIEEKRAFLFANRIALWDVIASCETEDSSDTSIKNAIPTDLTPIFATADIQAIFANGKLAHKLAVKYVSKDTIYLPSTSPANAAWSLERLTDAWQSIRI